MVSIIKMNKILGSVQSRKNEGKKKRRSNRKRPKREIKKYAMNEATGR